jgi:hypothetical protein
LDANTPSPIFALPKTSRVRLRVRTPPFHGGDTGSNPVRGTSVTPTPSAWDFFINAKPLMPSSMENEKHSNL